jgi:hypothetical protein
VDASELPHTNGVRSCWLDEYTDPLQFPHIAVLQFTDDVQPIRENIEDAAMAWVYLERRLGG